jgi:hypothetical protein
MMPDAELGIRRLDRVIAVDRARERWIDANPLTARRVG